ncbi:uncharacterized protein LOC115210851, partial [Argonauta hians]
MNSYNASQDDDISIIPNDEDCSGGGIDGAGGVGGLLAAIPNLTFTVSANRQHHHHHHHPNNHHINYQQQQQQQHQQHQVLTSITSMSALKDAYDELKKKYNDLNTRYQELLKVLEERNVVKQIKTMLPLDKDNPEEMKRRSEVDTLHKAVSKLKKELAAEKSKNQKLRSQMQSHGLETTPNTSLTSKEIGSMESLDKLMENIQFLEQIVELHQMEVRKVRLHRNSTEMVTSIGTTPATVHPRRQLEHDELDILNLSSGGGSSGGGGGG